MPQLKLPRPTSVIAVLALFLAVAGGSAIALKGRNSVDSGDLRRGSVKTSDLARSAVNSRKIRDGQVRARDLAAPERFHIVGALGEPQLSNGGANDCVWSKAAAPPLRLDPPAFWKDPFGVVHLTGVLEQGPGPGGDASCSTDPTPDGYEDRTVFVLPPGYRPQNEQVFHTPLGVLIVIGETTLNATGGPIAAGTVFDFVGAGDVNLSGITFRAAGADTGMPAAAARAGEVAAPLGEGGRP